MLSADDLIAFERDIADEFNAAKIKAPIHLSGGNEAQLIDIFRDVGNEDWVATTWRSHYHCLLKGVPPKRLKTDILAGRSITLNYPEHKIVSSAIVGGILPIALGIAMGIRAVREWNWRMAGWAPDGEEAFRDLLHRPLDRVHVFIGDMTAETGMAHEAFRYARGHNLPIRFIVEDNGKSVCTPTAEVWGSAGGDLDFRRYRYELPWPHSGAGQRVEF